MNVVRPTLVASQQVRPVIESVRPQVDGGRRPAKAAVGDTVMVEAVTPFVVAPPLLPENAMHGGE